MEQNRRWKFRELNDYMLYLVGLNDQLTQTDDPIEMMIIEEEIHITKEEVKKRYGEGKVETYNK